MEHFLPTFGLGHQRLLLSDEIGVVLFPILEVEDEEFIGEKNFAGADRDDLFDGVWIFGGKGVSGVAAVGEADDRRGLFDLCVFKDGADIVGALVEGERRVPDVGATMTSARNDDDLMIALERIGEGGRSDRLDRSSRNRFWRRRLGRDARRKRYRRRECCLPSCRPPERKISELRLGSTTSAFRRRVLLPTIFSVA